MPGKPPYDPSSDPIIDQLRPGEDPLEQLRAWIAEAAAADAARERVDRGPERRQRERRGRAADKRRGADAEWNRNARAALCEHILSLPRTRLAEWIDGLWLGRLPDAELSYLLDCARYQPLPKVKRRRGPLVPLLWQVQNLSSLRPVFRSMSDALQPLARLRRLHHLKENRLRRGFRSLEWRQKGEASPIGAALAEAGLFDSFFDSFKFTPTQMAAQLLRAELLAAVNQWVGADPTPDARRLAQQYRRDLASWRSLYNKLR